MAGKLVKEVLMRITADDGNAEEKIDRIAAKGEELKRLHPDLTPKIDAAIVSAKIGVIRAELRGLSRQADEEAAKGGLLRRMLGFGGGFGGGFGAILGKLPLVPGGGGDVGAAAQAPGGQYGIAAAAGVIGATLPALLTEADALVSGFAAAGAGAGAFALLAVPAVKSVEGAYTNLNTAMQKYNAAVALQKEDPTKAHMAAVKSALDQVNLAGQAIQKLPGSEQGAIDGVYKLTRTFSAMSQAFQPEAFKVFSGLLTLANELLPHLTPFATAFADAFSGLLGQADKFAGSKGFTDWLKQFQGLVGPSTTAIGVGVGHLVTNFGKLLTLMSAQDVVNGINIAFSVLDGILIGLGATIKGIMVTWDALTTAWDKSVDGLRRGGHDVAEGFDAARHGAATAGHGIAAAFDAARHGAATAGHDVASAFDGVRGALARQLEGDEAWVKANWKAVASFLVNPIATAVFEIRTHTHQIAAEFDRLRHDAAAILAGMRHDIASAFDAARHDASAAMAGMRHGVASAWDGLRHDAARWGDDMLHTVEHAWDSLFGSTKRGGAQVTGYVGGLPGRITSELARLPGDMLAIGRNTIEGLIRGIESAASAIPGIMKQLAGDVASYFTDPLKIFSPSRVMYEHGRMVPEGIALGIESGVPRIQQAVAKATRAVQGAGVVHQAGAGGAGAGRIVIEIRGDAALRQWLKKSIRVTGGNVQVVGA